MRAGGRRGIAKTATGTRTLKPSLDHVIGQVRRRLVWKLRLARLARCLAVACSAAVAASAVLLCLRRPSVIAPAALIALGLFVGAAWAAAVRVTHIAAAMWADGRFGLKDLLATAWSLQGSKAACEPWAPAVLAVADERSSRIPPADLRLPIGGRRMWSAIGLSAALAVTLGLISTRPDDAALPASIASAMGEHQQPTEAGAAASLNLDIPQLRPAGDSALNEISQRTGTADDSTAAADSAGNTPGASGNDLTTGTESGASAGLSRTPVSITPDNQTALGQGASAPNAPAASGGSGEPAASTPGNAGNLAALARTAPFAPPWQSPQWPAARQSALQSIRNNTIDPASRDLVSDYFTRP
jgi:hypothetical protein